MPDSRFRRGGLALAIAIAACGAPSRPADVIVYASGTDLESANPLVTVHPLSRQVQRYVLLVTLARYDSLLAPVPYAAREWRWSADRRELRFQLVPTLSWQDGPRTTSRDVAFTLLAARDPATGYARSADLAGVDTVLAPDDSTVIVRFNAPPPDFPRIFCELPIAPAHRLAATPRRDMKRAAFNTAPVGNGPFRFVERRAGRLWRFERNPEFPAELGGPPIASGLVVAVVDEATTKFAGLASGDLDVAGISPTMAALAGRDPMLRVVQYPILFTTGMMLNVHRPPFDDARVRRAIDLSVNRERILSVALAGFGTPAGGAAPPENPLALARPKGRDGARIADSLLDAAGWVRGSDGVRRRGEAIFDFELVTVGSADNAIEQLIQGDLAARGIRMRIRQMEGGAFLTMARAPAKDFDALLTGISGDLSLSYLAAMFETAQHRGTLDYVDYHDPAVDAGIALARGARSDEARRSAWHLVQQRLLDSMPAVWLYHSRGVQGVASRLEGVTMDLRGEMVSITRWKPGRSPGSR